MRGNKLKLKTIMKRKIKSKIEYKSIINPEKIIRAWNKHKAAKKLKTDISNIREVKQKI